MKKLKTRILSFRDSRNWKQFHTPENLAKSISIEAAELLENFQWDSKDYDIENIKDELADIMTYVILFADYFDFDLEQIVLEKLKKNEEKYPVSKAYGKSTKYNKL
jgi:NTP pyrophosphatase (non-canonical NTP hydrolase)